MKKYNLSKVSSFLLVNLIITGVFFGIPKKMVFNNINSQSNLNDQQKSLASNPILPPSKSQTIFDSQNDNFIFDPFYFEGDLNKLWQRNLNYQKALEIKSQSSIDVKFLLNILNQKKLMFEKQFTEKTLVQNALFSLKIMASGLIKAIFNKPSNNDDYIKIGNAIYQFDLLLKKIRETNLVVDEDFKNRFSTPDKAISEFEKRINIILGSNFDVNNNENYKNILNKIVKIEAQKTISRQTVLLKKLITQNPKWFNLNDKIDINNNWETKWENEYNLNLIKIADLNTNLQQKKITINQVAKALKRYVLEKQSMVIRLSTNRKKFIQIQTILYKTDYFNPLINVKFNNKIIFNEIVGLISDFLRYIHLKTQTIDQNSILLKEWDETKINPQIIKEINDVFLKLIYKIKIYLDVKKIAIPNFFNPPPGTKKELDLLQILSIYSSLSGQINNNYLKAKLKELIAKNNSAKWMIDLKKWLAKLWKVRISKNILLQPDNFKEIIDNNLQKRIIALLKANNNNLRTIYQRILDNGPKPNVYYDKNIVENLKIRKYISDPIAEQKKFLLVNIYDKTTFDDYNLILRYEQNVFKIIYFGRSIFQTQLKHFIQQDNDEITNTQLNLKFSSYSEIKDKILLIKEYKIAFPARYNLKADDFENDGKIKHSKLIDRSFTNQQRNAVWNMKIKDLNDLLYDKVINKLIEIKDKYDSFDSELQQHMKNIMTNLKIDFKVLENDEFYLYKNDQLKAILDLNIKKIANLFYYDDLRIFLDSNQKNISLLKLFNINMFQTLIIKLEDFNTEGKFINLAKEKILQETITKVQLDQIKNKLSSGNIEAEFKKQTSSNQEAIDNMLIFLRLKNALLSAKPIIFSNLLNQLGFSLSQVSTNSDLYQKIIALNPNQKNVLKVFGGLNALNKYYDLNKNQLSDRQYSLVYREDVKKKWVWGGWDGYWYNYDYSNPFANGRLEISDNAKLAAVQNYDQDNKLNEAEKTFLRRAFILLSPLKDNQNELFVPVYKESNYWRTKGRLN